MIGVKLGCAETRCYVGCGRKDVRSACHARPRSRKRAGPVMKSIEPKPPWERWWGRILVAITPSCEKTTRLISDSLDRPIPPWRRLSLHLHYKVCVWCLRYKEQLHLLHRSLPAGSDRLSRVGMDRLPDAARASLCARMEAEMAGQSAVASTPARTSLTRDSVAAPPGRDA